MTRYVKEEHELLDIVERQSRKGGRMLCIDLNPRPQVFTNLKGYQRAARESDIAVAQSILFDLDAKVKGSRATASADFKSFLKEADAYFKDLGLQPPVRASSGRGYHLLFAHPPIVVADCPDIAERVARFAADVRADLHKELAALNVTLDRTHELRRLVRISGTAKPTVGLISHFYGDARREDAGLRDYLLNLPPNQDERASPAYAPTYGPALLYAYDQVPPIVEGLLKRDDKLNDIWPGRGKPDGSDTSGSGYDFSLAHRLMAIGIHDTSIIATAIALRPDTSYRKGGKGESYLRRTIAKALMG